ncbi:MAG: PQQ-dependent sugar dehydrogenase [Acidobacteriota bacterium]|nr:PQQ-dependent sugar dehydrogenase [Acidobacteriota bacterium]
MACPPTTPLADGGGGACDEIFAWGLRNPWRNDLDPLTGDFYIADVGQSCWEEVNVTPAAQAAGGNYGWRSMEGSHCFVDGSGDCDPAGISCGGSPDCGDPSLVLPALEYPHSEGCSVTGGVVYRGCRLPGLEGRYFYGDYCSGWVRSFLYADGTATDPQDHSAALDPGSQLPGNLSSFGRDGRGEVYLVHQAGKVLKILPLFTDLVVSAPGAGTPFLLGDDWTWEDLAFETGHPVTRYRIYRALRPGTGDFTCVHRTANDTPVWTGGDPETPPVSQAFAYLVTALSPEGEESDDGHPGVGRIAGGCP